MATHVETLLLQRLKNLEEIRSAKVEDVERNEAGLVRNREKIASIDVEIAELRTHILAIQQANQ